MRKVEIADNPWPKHIFNVINEPLDIKTDPKILIIIPSKDRNDLLFQCIESILTHTSEKLTNVHIRIVDTGSTEENKKEIDKFITEKYKKYKDERFFIGCDYQGFYNFAKNNNKAFKTFGKGMDYVVFCNNDIKILNDVLSHMVWTFENKPKAGTVGARLHFGDGLLQHIGAFCRMDKGMASPGHFGFGKPTTGSVLDACQPVPANTAALLMMKSSVFKEIQFSEEYNECFEDVQLNLQVAMRGFMNFCHLGAVAFHYESQSRNEDPDKAKRQMEDLKKLSTFVMAHKNNNFIKEICFD
jgi:GT2 family glycosyltransferase